MTPRRLRLLLACVVVLCTGTGAAAGWLAARIVDTDSTEPSPSAIGSIGGIHYVVARLTPAREP